MTDAARRAEIESIEGRIEQLADEANACRKYIAASRIAALAGGALALAALIGIIGFDPLTFFGGVTLAIGGIVFYGSNTSTLGEKLDMIREAEAQRAELISGIGLRLVE